MGGALLLDKLRVNVLAHARAALEQFELLVGGNGFGFEGCLGLAGLETVSGESFVSLGVRVDENVSRLYDDVFDGTVLVIHLRRRGG